MTPAGDIFDPNNIPNTEFQHQHEQLQQRQWRPATVKDTSPAVRTAIEKISAAGQTAVEAISAAGQTLDSKGRRAIEEARAAVEEAKEAAGRAKSAVVRITVALHEVLSEIRDATKKSLQDFADAAKARTITITEIEAAGMTQISKIAEIADARLAAASAPPPTLAPIDLDETYTEKDFASASLDSIMWVAFERRRVLVRNPFGYTVDYSRASRKPPTALAMDMIEYFVNHPEKLNWLFQRVMRLAGKEEVAVSLSEDRPKSQDELDAEAYMRSVRLLPPEGETAQIQ